MSKPQNNFKLVYQAYELGVDKSHQAIAELPETFNQLQAIIVFHTTFQSKPIFLPITKEVSFEIMKKNTIELINKDGNIKHCIAYMISNGKVTNTIDIYKEFISQLNI